ncbi:hypothetical protein XU18_4523 [Perkinsela sp. CCAP 1560/4]|nr:hypothetical protein XU18_5019 [Perkinsela sp. CCAP 1560/4]KNH04169.1 hypothetical protein XU18_4523 [Perkinsela sp. CCAP 1560/4]|eukprot:KNH03615.1 hypothetical protein XU18_5019 [Perkinsela sp. CCAP 1560/4]
MLAGFICISVDPSSGNESFEWQNALMRLFLADISTKGMKSISSDYEQGKYYHQWQSIVCTEKLVKRIHYSEFLYANFNRVPTYAHALRFKRISCEPITSRALIHRESVDVLLFCYQGVRDSNSNNRRSPAPPHPQ